MRRVVEVQVHVAILALPASDTTSPGAQFGFGIARRIQRRAPVQELMPSESIGEHLNVWIKPTYACFAVDER
jgi:hypothetical protein